jgi:hypothetical protein
MALDIPALPTDSLYKFQAFTGLFLSVGTLVYVYKLIDQSIISINETSVESKILNVEVGALDRVIKKNELESEKINSEIDSVANTVSALTKQAADLRNGTDGLSAEQRSANAEIISNLSDKAQEQLQAVDIKRAQHGENILKTRQLVDNSRIKIITLSGKIKLINYQYRKIISLSILGIAIFILGISLAITGFRRWQIVQNDVDAAIHIQAQQKK